MRSIVVAPGAEVNPVTFWLSAATSAWLAGTCAGAGAAAVVVADELAETRDQLLSLGCKSALEKVATFLLRIASRNRRAGRDDERLQLPMTRAEIADYLGLTIETVSRNFTRLRKAGAIR